MKPSLSERLFLCCSFQTRTAHTDSKGSEWHSTEHGCWELLHEWTEQVAQEGRDHRPSSQTAISQPWAAATVGNNWGHRANPANNTWVLIIAGVWATSHHSRDCSLCDPLPSPHSILLFPLCSLDTKVFPCYHMHAVATIAFAPFCKTHHIMNYRFSSSTAHSHCWGRCISHQTSKPPLNSLSD